MAFPSVVDFPPLREANDLLGDRATLDEALRRDGYLFFRDVLDRDAVAEFRASILTTLTNDGQVEPGSDGQPAPGRDPARLRESLASIARSAPWKRFVQNPHIHGFFARLLNDEPYWVPITQYRLVPPVATRSSDRFDYRHADFKTNGSLDFLVCWVPLSDIDEEVGGLAVAEGLSGRTLPHFIGPRGVFEIEQASLPEQCWRRSDYHPGDILIMSIDTPHSGIANHSDHFRLSVDLRLLPASGAVPLVGDLTAIGPAHIDVQTANGGQRVRYDADTYCRGADGKQIVHADVATTIPLGQHSIVAVRDGVATLVRPANP